MNLNQLNTICEKETLYVKDENEREIYIYTLNDVNFGGSDLFYPNVVIKYQNSIISPLEERTMSLEKVKNRQNINFVDEITSVENNPVFFFVYNTDNYFHFVYDTLPYLISYLQLKKKHRDLKLLVNYPNSKIRKFYKFVEEFYEIIGIEPTDIIMIDNKINYKRVYISSSYTHGINSNLPPRKEIFELYKDIVKKTLEQKNNYENTPKKIYISRRSCEKQDISNIGTNYTSRRKFVNEDRIIEYLTKKGFVEIFTENLNTIDKINIFFNADIIVGPIGGGLCNVVFSKKNTKLIAIESPTFLDLNTRFSFCLKKVNTIYFKKTRHIETEYWKKYMRIQSGHLIGEIEEVKEENLIISYVNQNVSGWNNQFDFDLIEIPKIKCTALDSGLNSAWEIDINEFYLFFENQLNQI